MQLPMSVSNWTAVFCSPLLSFISVFHFVSLFVYHDSVTFAEIILLCKLSNCTRFGRGVFELAHSSNAFGIKRNQGLNRNPTSIKTKIFKICRKKEVNRRRERGGIEHNKKQWDGPKSDENVVKRVRYWTPPDLNAAPGANTYSKIVRAAMKTARLLQRDQHFLCLVSLRRMQSQCALCRGAEKKE